MAGSIIFFPKATYWVFITEGVSVIAQSTAASSLDTGPGPSLFNSSVLPLNWQTTFEHVKATTEKSATKEAISVKDVISQHICINDLYALPCYCNVAKIAVD